MTDKIKKKNTVKTLLFTVIIIAMIVSFDYMNLVSETAHAQQLPGGDEYVEDPYTIEEISHAFEVMSQYSIFDEYSIITYDQSSANNDNNVYEIDIKIVTEFAKISNDLMNISVGSTGEINEDETDTDAIKDIIADLQVGIFRELFTQKDHPRVNELSMSSNSYMTPTIHTLYESEIKSVNHDWYNPLTACHGGFLDPHPWHAAVIHPANGDPPFTEQEAEDWLNNEGYHQVLLATLHYPNDYAKIDRDAPGNCNSGPFRDQAVKVSRNTGIKFNTQYHEPNPELLYLWPANWWGPYVFWWHETDAGRH